MTRTTTNLLGILITILAGTWFYLMLCSDCKAPIPEEPAQEVAVPIVPDPTSYPFAFNDGDFSYSVNDNYNFNVSSPAILIPLSQKVSDGVMGLKDFLAENADNVITITGYYNSDEANNTAYPNLGMARASAVKNHFVENGISSSQINIKGQLMGEMVPKDGVYLGPVAFGIVEKAIDAEDQLKALYEKIKANPLVLYFDTAEASINLSAEQRQKFADISRYLDKVPGATAQVVGHTDNTGEKDSNLKLGQERADFAKAYLLRNGITASKINATSQGSDNPIASNATEEGKSKNRRTIITLN